MSMAADTAFDPRCMEFPTVMKTIIGVAALPRAWKNDNEQGKICLTDLGLSREEHGNILQLVRDAQLNPWIDEDCGIILKMCPQLLYASLEAMRVYMSVTQQSRGYATQVPKYGHLKKRKAA